MNNNMNIPGLKDVIIERIEGAGEVLGTSSSTVIRRFKEVMLAEKGSGVRLPEVIVIDEYKGDTDAGTYQLIIAKPVTHEPIDILLNRRKESI